MPGPGADPERRRALLEAAEEVAGLGSWEWIPSRSELLFSDNLFRLLGLEPGEAEPSLEFIDERLHADDRERFRSDVRQLAEAGALPRPTEYRIVRSEGRLRHLRVTLAVAEEREGRPYRLIGSAQDITEQRRAEREIAAHYAVAEALTEWEELDSGARRLLANLGRAMGFILGTLWVQEGDVLVARVIWHPDSVQLPQLVRETRRAHLPRGVGLPGRAWEQREPVSALAAGEGPMNVRRAAAEREGMGGAVAIPAVCADEVLAVVELASREEPELTERLMRSLTGIGYELGQFLSRRRGELEPPRLTAREREVLQLAAQGLSAPRTAERLVVSTATVKTHLENIYGKLGVSDKASAVAHALRLGIIH